MTASRPDEPLNLITTESDSDQGPGVNHILRVEKVEIAVINPPPTAIIR